MLDSRLYDKTSIQANFQNSQFGLLDEQPSQTDNFSKNLHKTLKSILPNANISFGATNANTNYQANMANANRNSLNFNNTNGNNFWPDDPAIVSLTDRSHLLQNGNLINGASQFQSLNDFHLANGSSNNTSSNNGNRAVSPLSNNKNTINNMKLNQRAGLVNNLINQSQKLNENSADQLLNSHQYLLQNFNNNSVNGKPVTADENLNLNLAQYTPFLYRFQSSFNNDSNNNTNSLLSNGLNDQLSLLNQETNLANLNNLNLASLTLQQQFFMQQLSANFSAKKLPSE